MDGHLVQHVEGGVQLQGLTAALTHEADLGSAAGGLGALHDCIVLFLNLRQTRGAMSYDSFETDGIKIKVC